jgi:hypothetical protein
VEDLSLFAFSCVGQCRRLAWVDALIESLAVRLVPNGIGPRSLFHADHPMERRRLLCAWERPTSLAVMHGATKKLGSNLVAPV